MSQRVGHMMVALVITTVLMSGCNPSDDAPVSDLQRLQGTWVGKEVGKEGEVKVVISDDTIHFTGASPQEWYKGTMVLNEETTPKQADVTISECAMWNYVGKISKAIYKREELSIELTLAGSEPGDESRPSTFEPSAGTRVFHLTASVLSVN